MAREYLCICRICGKAFIGQKPTIMSCSPECRVELRKQRKGQRYNNRYYKKAKTSTAKIESPTLADVAKAAHAVGMTYGQYVAKQEK